MRVHNFAFCNLAKIAMPDPVGTLGTVHRAPRARRARTRSLPPGPRQPARPGRGRRPALSRPDSCQRGAGGGGARGWLPVERTGGELRTRAALPVDH